MCFVLLQLGIEPRILFTELYPHSTRSVLQDVVVVMIRNSGGLTVLKAIGVLTYLKYSTLQKERNTTTKIPTSPVVAGTVIDELTELKYRLQVKLLSWSEPLLLLTL